MPDQKIDAIAAKVDRIYTEVVGDAAFGNPGIVGRQKEHDVRLTKVEGQIKEIKDSEYKRGVVVATTATGIGAVGGAVGWVAVKPLLLKFIAFLGSIKI